MAFDLDMIYNSCFPPTEILDWFIHHGNGPSAEIQLPSNLYDGDWIGVALCAYFTYNEHPSTFIDNFDPKIPQFLICNFGLDTLHLYQMTNEVKKIDGEFIWLSYIPRLWFSDQWKHSCLVEASFASDIGGLRAQKCGLRLLYRHDEEEFKRIISYCMASMIENKDPVSHVKADNEGKKKVLDDGHDPQHERLEGADNATIPMDKGKEVTE
nr:disease resistance protein RPS4B-like [Ziziphus jujuba var. spinosa]